MLHTFYDNTAKVAVEAQELLKKGILNDARGNEKQLYKVGQNASGMGFGFEAGKIVEAYNNLGYWYYVVEYKLTPKARKTYTKTLRQKDIKTI